MKNFIFSISDENLVKILSILITAISTYFIAKYNSNTPLKLKIKQKQLDKVYIPLYKLIIPDIGNMITKELALDYVNKIKPILWDNYEFVYPQLHELTYKFLSAIKSDDDYQTIFDKICYQIELDYDLLKKSLGYPSENSLGLFRRMSVEDKINSILGWINVIMIINPILLIIFNSIPFIHQNYIKLLFSNYALLSAILFLELHTKKVPRNPLNK